MPYLKERCQFWHELENISEVDERQVDNGTKHHEEDGVEVLHLEQRRDAHHVEDPHLGVVHDGRDHQVDADDQHDDRDDDRTLGREVRSSEVGLYQPCKAAVVWAPCTSARARLPWHLHRRSKQ